MFFFFGGESIRQANGFPILADYRTYTYLCNQTRVFICMGVHVCAHHNWLMPNKRLSFLNMQRSHGRMAYENQASELTCEGAGPLACTTCLATHGALAPRCR
jgi:hypothetical protein